MRNSVLEELRVRRFADIQEEMCFRAVWRWAVLESNARMEREKKLCIICIKVVVKRKYARKRNLYHI